MVVGGRWCCDCKKWEESLLLLTVTEVVHGSGSSGGGCGWWEALLVRMSCLKVFLDDCGV